MKEIKNYLLLFRRCDRLLPPAFFSFHVYPAVLFHSTLNHENVNYNRECTN